MKATELMIGDLINGFGVVRRVTSIHGLERPEDEGLLTTMVPGFEFPESNLSFRPCYAQPIPLTGEMLEKNGFKVRRRYILEQWINHCCVKLKFAHKIEIEGEIFDEPPILLQIDTDIISLNIIVEYVDELQHALRLCGVEIEITI
jgi:hypothetical protein